LRTEMSGGAGVLRDAPGLTRAGAACRKLAAQRGGNPDTESWEATNLVTVASALVAAAASRVETRGSHWREDHPDPDERWLGHLDLRLGPDGSIHTEYRPADTNQRGLVR